MMYFKIIYGYGEEDFLSITEEDLKSAYHAHLNGVVVLFRNGSTLNGKNIITIKPDWHREASLPREEKLLGSDKRRIGNKRLLEYRAFMKKEAGVVLSDMKNKKLKTEQQRTKLIGG